MKYRVGSSGLRAVASTMAAAMPMLLSGCERSPSAASSSGPTGSTEVRGAPIQTIAKKAQPAAPPSTEPPLPSSGQSSPLTSPATGTPVSASASPPAPSSGPGTPVASPVAALAAPAQKVPMASTAPIPAAPTSSNSGPIALNFEQLAGYTFEVSDDLLGPVTNDVAVATEKTNAKIPDKVKSYDRKKVALKGFMLPLKVEGGLVTEMLIMKDQSMCCYGTTPRINDWVSVKMKKKGVRPTMDLPVTLFGTMRIGEMRENGYLVGIYSMDGEEMEAPEAQ